MAGPVNGILDMARILKDGHLDRAQRECVSAIDVSAQALSSLAAELSEFSVDESGRLQIVKRPFDLGHLVRDVALRMEPLAKERGDSLDIRIPTLGLPDLLSGDEGKIAQALQTLLANAIKFTENGRVSVELSNAGDSRYRFRVSDSGPGISQEKLKRIFELSGDVLSGRYGGVTLGLAVARELVEAMGGTLEASSEKGKGSSFSFSLPLDDASL
jgi:signal transduction histidine kinase